MTVLYPQQEAQIIAAQLQGQVLRLPNLQNLFAGWPLEIHPRLQELVTFSEGITLNILESKDRIAMHKRGNLARYVAMWFPHAEFDRLKTVCLLNDWMHAWDDSVDNDRYDLARDFEKASRFRHDTLVLWNSVLGFTDQDVTQLPVDGVYRINNILPDLGRRLCASYNKAQLRRLLDTITWFIESCAIEHELRLSMRIPLYDEYIKLREGAGGAPPMIEMIELANHTALPEWMFSTPEMQIMKETLVHAIVLVNDIYSLKKELDTGCLITSISALMKTGATLDEAAQAVVDKIKYSVTAFDHAAAILSDKIAHDPIASAEFEAWLHGARSLVTGTWKFSISSKRYNLSGAFKIDGSLAVQL